MTSETMIPLDARMQAAIAEMKHLILQHFPEATFELGPGEDPVGMHLTATVDREDLWDSLISAAIVLSICRSMKGYHSTSFPAPLARTMEMLQRARERTPWVYRAVPDYPASRLFSSLP